MTEVRSARGHALLYMAPTVVQSVLPIVTLPIFTRVLSREEYGLWGIATAFGALVAGTCGLGLQSGFERNYFAAPHATARERLLYSVVLLAFVLQGVGLVGLVVFGPFVATRLMDSPQFSHLLLLGFGLAALGSVKMFFLSVLRNEGQAGAYVRYSIDELFLGAVLSLAAVLWLRWGVTGLLAGPLLASTVVLVALVGRFLRRAPFGLDGAQLKDTVRVSLPLAPRALVSAVGTHLDRLVLGAVGSLAAVGVYAIGQRMAQIVFGFMTALQNVYQPRVYRMLFVGESPQRIGSFLLPFAYASVTVALGAILFSTEIVRLVAAPEFFSAALILAVLAVHYGGMFFGKQPQLIFARRTDIALGVSTLSVVLNTAGAYVGARTAGALGAAFGILVAGLVSTVTGLFFATRFAPIDYPVRDTVLIFAALPVALMIALSLHFLQPPFIVSLAAKALLFALFLAIGWRSGLIRAVWHGTHESAQASV